MKRDPVAATGDITVHTEVQIVAVSRLRGTVTVKIGDGAPKTLRAGDVLTVHSDVKVTR